MTKFIKFITVTAGIVVAYAAGIATHYAISKQMPEADCDCECCNCEATEEELIKEDETTVDETVEETTEEPIEEKEV